MSGGVIAGLVGGLAGAVAVGLLTSLLIREAEGWIDALPSLLLRLARRRVPTSHRETLYDEWAAELHTALNGVEGRPLSRVLFGIRLAAGWLRAARHVADELGPVRNSSPEDLADVTERSLVSGIEDDAVHQMRTMLEYAEIALQNGEATEARARFAELLTNPGLSALPALARRVRWGHALALESMGDLEEAIDELATLGENVSPKHDTNEWSRLHIAVSRCHRERGDLARSVSVAEEAFAQMTTKPGPWSDETVKLGATLAGAYLERDDLVSARQLTDRLIEAADENGSPVARMAAYWEAALVAKHQADFGMAVSYAQRALALLGEQVDPRNSSRLRAQYGTLLLAESSNVAHARDELQRAIDDMTETAAGDVDIARCLTELARAEIAMGEPDRAADRAGEALDLLEDEPRLATVGALIVFAEACIRLGRTAEAIDVADRATACLEQMQPSREAAQSWFNLAELLAETGTPERRAEAYHRALACAGL